MTHPSLHQEIASPADKSGREGGFSMDGFAEGAKEGLFSVQASRKDFGLTPLEKQVIALIASGYSRKEWSKRIGISESAFRLHFKGICGKLGVSNQLELILFALHHKLIDT